MIFTFIILLITILLFVFSKLRPDLVALLALLALYVAGIVDAGQALAGFANSTVIMVAALFVVGEGLARTGVTAWLGEQLLRQAGGSETRLMVVLMLGTAILSAFLSNTGTVAMLLPAVVASAWHVGSAPSRLLIPLAFAANLGGLLTLIGTAPNIVVSDALRAASGQPFGFFEFSMIGLPLLLAAVAYLLLLGRRLLPAHSSGGRSVDLKEAVGELALSYRLRGKLFQLRVRNGSSLVGKTLRDAGLGRDYGVSILRVDRPLQRPVDASGGQRRRRRLLREQLEKLQDNEQEMPRADTVIRTQDLLLVKGNPQAVEQAMVDLNLGIQSLEPDDEDLTELLLSQEIGVAEVLLTPRSSYIGRTIAESQIAEKFNIQVITLRRGDKLVPRKAARLDFGDSLLVRGQWQAFEMLRRESQDFVVVGSPEAMARQVVELTPRSMVAIATLLGMVILLLTGAVPTVIATLLAAVVMILGGCLDMDGAYRAIGWQTVILIGAMLPMSTALEVTGGAALIANGLVESLGAISPIALMAGVFVLTAAFSQVISNTATAVLLAPIVVQAAASLGVAPQPLLMLVAVGASAAFLTPIASPVNTLVLAPGSYRFSDFARVGASLMLITLLVSLLLVPLIWPL